MYGILKFACLPYIALSHSGVYIQSMMVTLWVYCQQVIQKRQKQVWVQICLTRNWRSPFLKACHFSEIVLKTIVQLFTYPEESTTGSPVVTCCWLCDSDSPLGPKPSQWRNIRCREFWPESSLKAPPLGRCQRKKEVEAEKFIQQRHSQCFQLDFADPDMSPLRGLGSNWVGGGGERRDHSGLNPTRREDFSWQSTFTNVER